MTASFVTNSRVPAGETFGQPARTLDFGAKIQRGVASDELGAPRSSEPRGRELSGSLNFGAPDARHSTCCARRGRADRQVKHHTPGVLLHTRRILDFSPGAA